MTKDKRHYLQDLLDYLQISAASFAKSLGYDSPNKIYHILRFRNSISIEIAKDIVLIYSNVNYDWLLTGEGDMLKGDEQSDSTRNIIPLYDDVGSVGGTVTTSSTNAITSPSDYIDTGDWFRDATAAIRHYGESMVEYPTGCILAIKEVKDRNLVIPGRDYVIETSEYRVTKKIQIGDDCIRAYSTNNEKYEDGSLIHQPFNIQLSLINRIFLVLGYVVKKNGGSMIFSNTK